MNSANPCERLYRWLARAEVENDSRDLPPPARQALGANFLLIGSSLVLTKLGDLLASPKIVLTWVLSSIGVSTSVISYLVPIRESGALLPQIFLHSWVKSHAYRKGLWRFGAVVQGLSVLAMAWVIGVLPAGLAGPGVLALMIVFSLARSLCSLTVKDIQGHTLPKQRRGRLSGLASAVAGMLTVCVGLLFLRHQEQASLPYYLVLLSVAGCLWLLAAWLFSRIQEPRHAQAAPTAALSQIAAGLGLLRDDRLFRHFVLCRALAMGSALAAPFLIVLAQSKATDMAAFGTLLLAGSLGSSLSASVWGFMADHSSRTVLIRATLSAALCCLSVVATECWLTVQGVWHLATLYFVLSIAHAGVRIGRQTYLLDMADGNRRTDYVAVSNSIIGLLLLCMGAITSVLAAWSVPAVVLLLGLSCLAAAFTARLLPHVE